MTPTATQMQSAVDLTMYFVKMRKINKGLGGIEYPTTDTIFSGVGKNNASWIARERIKSTPDAQVWVECDNLIVAISVHGTLLWLDKVPPPKYWLDPKTRPLYHQDGPKTERVMAPCGLPIPQALLEKP
jgi:L,D-peptidoglycan transpeptidase YkuD (ErfK/YbiS/YcfS/YnhG family)